MKKYETIINGASIVGLSLALCDPQNTIIIDRGIILASEFFNTYRFDNIKDCKINEQNAKEFYELIKKK